MLMMNAQSRIKSIMTFLKSKNGVIIISIIWALGLAAMLRSICIGRQCYTIKPFKMKDILLSNQNYRHNDGKCYKYYPIKEECPN